MIGTGIALLMAGLGAAGSSAYGAKKTADTNSASVAATEKSNADAQAEARYEADLKDQEVKQAAQQAQDRYTQNQAFDKERWSDYLNVHAPMWQASGGVLNNLYGLAGLGTAPTMPMPSASAPPPGIATSSAASGAPSAATLSALMQQQGQAAARPTTPAGAVPPMAGPVPMKGLSDLMQLKQFADMMPASAPNPSTLTNIPL